VDSQGSSRLSSPSPTTSYGGSRISFPSATPRQTTECEGTIVGFPPSVIPLDPFSTPRMSAQLIAQKYIQSEENTSREAQESEEEEAGVPETPKRGRTPTFENSDSDDTMMEVQWREEEPYITPTKQGRKHNKGRE